MRTKNIDIHIVMGILGAGKTSFLRSFTRDFYIDCNRFKNLLDDYNKLFNTNKDYDFLYYAPKVVSIDGEFTHTDDVCSLLNGFIEWYNLTFPQENVKYKFNATIHYWDMDITACLHNCMFDETKKSELEKAREIGLVLEKPTVELIQDKLPNYSSVKCEYHTTEKSDIFIELSKKYMSDEGTLQSEYWNQSYSIPANFDAFDELIFTLKPDISYMLYKKIWKESNVHTHYDYDYESRLCYEVDIEELKAILIKYNLYSND